MADAPSQSGTRELLKATLILQTQTLARALGGKALGNTGGLLQEQGLGVFFLTMQYDILISDFTQILPIAIGSSSTDKGSETIVSDTISITRKILRWAAGATQIVISIIKTSYGSLHGVNKMIYKTEDVLLIKNTCARTSAVQRPVGRNVKWGPTERPARSIQFNSFINNLETRPGVC